MPKSQPKVIRDLNFDFRNNPKMLWIHFLVGISHFAKFRKNQPVTMRMLVNLKSPFLQWWEKWKNGLESVSGTGAPPKVNQFF